VNRETLILTAADVDAVLGVEACIEAVEGAFLLLGLGRVDPPGVLGVHVDGGGFHIKAATLAAERHYFAAKTNGNFPDNPTRSGLPTIQGVIVLCDAADGRLLALLDSIRITELRTAAATAVAARYLSRPDSSAAVLIGCGAQAASQIRALAAIRPLDRVDVFDLDSRRVKAFAESMDGELDARVQVGADLAASLATCDVCITCTPSRQPLVGPGMLPHGAFVAAVGADNPHKHEITAELMRDAKVVVDSLEQCREIGDLHHALDAGAMDEGDVHAELGAVVAGLAEGWTAEDGVVVFDSTGMGLQDVASAAVAYERAVEQGRGLRVALADD
jgi:ornithine cyclodeaminase/alanine dehydrogenase-like protein (mu-crystallin family)